MEDVRLRTVWYNMKYRCENPNSVSYDFYGARGIKVCQEWESFALFKEWALTHGYDPDAPRGKCTLDRINVNGNYEPSNCRFISMKMQARNRQKHKYIEIDGVKKIAPEWAEEYGIPLSRFIYRINHGEKGRKLIRPCRIYASPNIKRLREMRGNVELADMAYDSGVAYYTISRIERGKDLPGKVVQKLLAKYFNKPDDYFYCKVEDVNE